MTRKRPLHRFRPAAAALWLLAALPVAGQEQPLPDLFSDVIDVRVVNVEAVVTDRKGNRVRGLTANDFELLVDGEPAPIAYFTEIDEGTVRAAPAGAAEIAEAIPALHAGEPVGTNFLVFIDDFFSIRQHRDGVLRGLEEDLTQLRPADRVAAVASDGANVTLLTGWTNSHDEIRAALRQAQERPALGLMRRVDQRAVPQSSSKQEIQQAKRYLAEQVKRSALAAVATLRSFAGREGRKVMLVLAGGWGLPQPTFEDDQPTLLDINVDSVLGPLVDAANLVGYTLYPVDVPGFRATSSNDASVGYSDDSDGDPSTPARHRRGRRPFRDADREDPHLGPQQAGTWRCLLLRDEPAAPPPRAPIRGRALRSADRRHPVGRWNCRTLSRRTKSPAEAGLRAIPNRPLRVHAAAHRQAV